MLALGSNEQAERDAFEVHAAACGKGNAPWFCSRSCEELGRHVLIFPDPHETYDQAVERARLEPLTLRVVPAKGETACPAPS